MRLQQEEMQMQRGRLRRILCVYAMLNRGVGYVQGMNEIAAGILEEVVLCSRQGEKSRSSGILPFI